MNTNIWHITPCHYLLIKIEAKLQKQCVYPTKLLLGPNLGAKCCSNGFLGDSCLTSLWRNSSLQRCCCSFMHSSLKPTTAFQLSWGLDFGPLQYLDFFCFFSQSVGDLLLCVGSLSSYMTQFGQSFSCGTHGRMFDSRAVWCTEDFMVTASFPNHRPSTTVLTVGLRCLCWCAVWFSPNVLLYIMNKQSNLEGRSSLLGTLHSRTCSVFF